MIIVFFLIILFIDSLAVPCMCLACFDSWTGLQEHPLFPSSCVFCGLDLISQSEFASTAISSLSVPLLLQWCGRWRQMSQKPSGQLVWYTQRWTVRSPCLKEGGRWQCEDHTLGHPLVYMQVFWLVCACVHTQEHRQQSIYFRFLLRQGFPV